MYKCHKLRLLRGQITFRHVLQLADNSCCETIAGQLDSLGGYLFYCHFHASNAHSIVIVLVEHPGHAGLEILLSTLIHHDESSLHPKWIMEVFR